MPACLRRLLPPNKWFLPFSGRAGIVWLCFVVWAGVIGLRLLQIMVVDRDTYLGRFHNKSWRVGVLPAIRGRILDRLGSPLAWSIRNFDLYYTPADDDAQRDADAAAYEQLTRITMPPIGEAGSDVLIRASLHPQDVLKLRQLTNRNKRFQIISTFRRLYATHDTRIRRLLGTTRIVDGREKGASGLEKRYNSRLTGIDGKYQVMVDKHDHWIAETWTEIQTPIPGYDVYVPINQ